MSTASLFSFSYRQFGRRSRSPPTSSTSITLPRRVKTTLVALGSVFVVFLLFQLIPSVPSPPPLSTGSHPFSLPGNLTYDKNNPFTTYYRPQNGATPPRLMEKLVRRTRGAEKDVADAIDRARLDRLLVDGQHSDSEKDDNQDFEWLRGRTILLMGDSLDRYHLLHLCQFLSPNTSLVPLAWPYHGTPNGVRTFIDIHPIDSPAYPEPLRDLENKLAGEFRDGKPFATETYRPWVCTIKQFDAVIVWTFLNGLDDGKTTPGVQVYGEEETEVVEGELVGKEGTWGDQAKELPFGDRAYWSVNSEHFNPPLCSEDRVKQLVLPFLSNIGRGGPRKVDMVEVGLAAWDLMMFKTQDQMSVANHIASLPPDTSPVPDLVSLSSALASQPLSAPRLNWYATRLDALLSDLVKAFPPTASSRFSSSYLPRISVRMQAVPPQTYGWPWITTENRVLQIEEEAKRVVRELNERMETERMRTFDGGHGEDWSGRQKSGEKRAKGKGGGMGEAVRYNDWAETIRGEGEWLDHVHPGPIPGSWLWADMMLYELRKRVTGQT